MAIFSGRTRIAGSQGFFQRIQEMAAKLPRGVESQTANRDSARANGPDQAGAMNRCRVAPCPRPALWSSWPGKDKPLRWTKRRLLPEAGAKVSEANIVVTSGRVRAGYEIGEIRFEKSDPNRFKRILHMIGEWPDATHHSYRSILPFSRARRGRKRESITT